MARWDTALTFPLLRSPDISVVSHQPFLRRGPCHSQTRYQALCVPVSVFCKLFY